MPKILMRRDTAANWSSVNPVLGSGEWGLETDSGKMKLGDGSSAWNALRYYTNEDDEWKKPADWPDIRSGVLDNSVYLLVAHSEPVENNGVFTIEEYPRIGILADVTKSSNPYDIYIDNVKTLQGVSGNEVDIYWEELYNSGKVKSIYRVTTPSSYVVHIMRITPHYSADKLKYFANRTDSTHINQSILWAHYAIDYPIAIHSALGDETRPHNILLQAVTATNNKLVYLQGTGAKKGYYGAFGNAVSLVKLPILEADDKTVASGTYVAFKDIKVKKIILKNSGLERIDGFRGSSVEEICSDNGFKLNNGTNVYSGLACRKLKRLPTLISDATCTALYIDRMDSLEPTFVNDSASINRSFFRFSGASAHPCNGLKGLIVSNQAPFDSATSPQLNVNYTGLDRSALINLFNSMPYNVGYTVEGSPTITDGVVSGFSQDDYLLMDHSERIRDITELVLKIRIPSSALGKNSYMDPLSGGFQFFVYSPSSGNKFTYPGFSFNGMGDLYCNTSFDPDTWYWVKYTSDGVTSTAWWSTDGINYNIGQSKETSTILDWYGTIRFGNNNGNDRIFDGEIDIKNCFVRVNNFLFFRGTEHMTKTCSIVGCTGTSQLTQEDKNIALNKGWQLTVS